MMEKIQAVRTEISIFTVWLFHLSALMGIGLGFQDWFMTKTPLNLCIVTILFLWVYPMDKKHKFLAFIIFFTGGMFAEWLGVNYSILFGDYVYGANFGPKLDGVPLLIGVNWALLTFITATIAARYIASAPLKVLCASFLMVLLDYLMEHTAPIFDFWTFEGGLAGLENYICWFGLAVVFQTILHFFRVQGNYRFSLHLFLAQFVFFGFLYLYL